MAKGNPGGEDRAKVKLRVIEFELEGANSSVENSIRQLTQALTSRSNGTPSPKPIPARQPSALPAGEEQAEEAAIDTEAETVSDAEVPSVAPSSPRSPRKPTVPEPIEIDLASGDMPFKQFCDERGITAASTDSRKYLVSAVWMKEHRQTPAIEIGHIYSIFKMMKWNLQSDIGAPLRGMKQQKWFTTPERGKFAINHLGENEVNRLSN